MFSVLVYKEESAMLDQVFTFCCQNNSLIAYLWIVITVQLIWLIVLSFSLITSKRYIKRLFGSISTNDLRAVLVDYLQRIGGIQVKLTEVERVVNMLSEESVRHISKVGVVRFNPYEDTGGNQSFILALLDGNDNGIVISSLYNRSQTRLYAKPVQNGIATGFELSKEEVDAIRTAQKMIK